MHPILIVTSRADNPGNAANFLPRVDIVLACREQWALDERFLCWVQTSWSAPNLVSARSVNSGLMAIFFFMNKMGIMSGSL